MFLSQRKEKPGSSHSAHLLFEMRKRKSKKDALPQIAGRIRDDGGVRCEAYTEARHGLGFVTSRVHSAARRHCPDWNRFGIDRPFRNDREQATQCAAWTVFNHHSSNQRNRLRLSFPWI